MKTKVLESVTELINKHSQHFVPIRIAAKQLRIWVDGPKMSIKDLRMVTSLTHLAGYRFEALREITESLSVTVTCGHEGQSKGIVTIKNSKIGPILVIDVSPMGMYVSEIVIETTNGMSLRELLDDCFYRALMKPSKKRSYFAGLVVEPVEDETTHGHH